MRILFLCGREPSYTRNASLLKALAANYEVTNISSSHKSYLIRHLIVIWRLLAARPSSYDIVFVGFYGQLLMPIVRLLTRRPIIFDAYISTYQTLCFDRKKAKPNSILGRVAFAIDLLSCRLATIIILDTNAHIQYFVETFKLPPAKFKRIFVGADESVFYPRQGKSNHVPLIFTYAQFQPLHGMEYIVGAAKLVGDKAFFRVVGTGQEFAKITAIIRKENIQNIELVGWLPYDQLPNEIANANICLGGHFGQTDKAGMVIAGKTYQFIAMNKPTIVTRNEANYELIAQSDGIYCEMGSAESLAEAIEGILRDEKSREVLTKSTHDAYLEKASGEAIKNSVATVIKSLVTDVI